jgi:hypothetical protein
MAIPGAAIARRWKPNVARNRARIERVAHLAATRVIRPPEILLMPLAEARRAHELSEAGHVRGKIVFVAG